MKKTGNIKKFNQYAYPMQTAIITVNDDKGRTNPITIAWHTPISKKPPLYAISIAPTRFSHRAIKHSKEFVINFAPFELVEKIHFCGTHSGRNTDKIKESGLDLENSEKIKTKYIKECYAHLECKLYRTVTLGDHVLIVGEVVNTKIDVNAFKEDVLDNKKIKPCYYLGDNSYTKIGDEKKIF
jgi:flavin reductase (DIM6/NTAB) family NADH-FMN oxidoreductase RutF